MPTTQFSLDLDATKSSTLTLLCKRCSCAASTGLTMSYRFSAKLHELNEAKLPVDPTAFGRLSPVGLCVTAFDVIFPWALSIAVPFFILQRVLCRLEECPFWMSKCEQLCDPSTLAPWFVVGYLVLESIFYIGMKIKLAYLQSIDPMEAYLKAGGVMSPAERQLLWDRVMEAESKDVAAYFENWFFDVKFQDLSYHEIQNFIAWGYFDGRNQEHLTDEEHKQLDSFVSEALERIETQRTSENGSSNVPIQSIAKQTSFKKKSSHANKLNGHVQKLRMSLEGTSSNASIQSMAKRTSLRMMSSPANEIQFRKLETQRLVLKQMLPLAHDIPEADLAQLMRNITESHTELFHNEKCSLSENLKLNSRRFGRPTADPILGVRISPLFAHVLTFLFTEIPLRVVLWAAGFERCRACSTTYYFRPGGKMNKEKEIIPLVFIHGIGLGPVLYLPLVFEMMKSDRPIFLPDVPSVSAFRPWVLPNAAKSPHQVAASLSTMLASHGFSKATFSGHSFGTFWMSYMAKYAPDFVAALVFLDPVCFCLYHSLLTQRVVYNRPDPGDIGYIVRTDMMVNWSVQRNFCWARGNLFVEDIGDEKPCVVFLSGDDRIAPSTVQESYLKSHGGRVTDFDQMKVEDLETEKLSVVVFRGDDHGGWAMRPFQTSPKVVETMEAVSTCAERIEKRQSIRRRRADRFSLRSSFSVRDLS